MPHEVERFKFTLDSLPEGDSKMYLEMVESKLFMNMKVFIDMSNFIQRGLLKLSEKKANAPTKALEVSSARSTIQIHMKDTLMILENKDITAKCVVIQTSTDLLMKSCDPKSFVLKPNEPKEFSSMVIEVKNACAFFCDINEITEVDIKEANKRDLL
jgi:hypothetical protein